MLVQGNVRTVLVSTGAADLLNCTSNADTCATEVEIGLASLKTQLNSYYTDDSQIYINQQPITQNSNITVHLATIPPFTAAHPGTATQEAARKQVNNYLLDNYPGQFIDFAAAVSTDGTATSSTVKAADLSDGNPSDAYYADLACSIRQRRRLRRTHLPAQLTPLPHPGPAAPTRYGGAWPAPRRPPQRTVRITCSCRTMFRSSTSGVSSSNSQARGVAMVLSHPLSEDKLRES